MKVKKLFVCFLSALLIVTFLTAATPGGENNIPSHCYSLLAPMNGNFGSPSQILKSACFNTFAEAMSAATNERVQLSPSILPEDVTNDILNNVKGKESSNAQIVIGIDWDYTNYGGSSYTWVVTGSGCTSSTQYNVPSMPSGWDNRVSSARAYSNCSFYHYQDTNFGGPFVACNTDCPTMGSLDNATSSEKWIYAP